jgi:hypothetical protein
MAKYMKTTFFFLNKTEERRRILRKFERNKEAVSANARRIALDLYSKSEREFQYCAIEI